DALLGRRAAGDRQRPARRCRRQDHRGAPGESVARPRTSPPASVAVVVDSRQSLMEILASGLSYFDLNFLGVPRIIATVVLHGPGGAALIDPGPSSTLPALRAGLASAGIRLAEVGTILLTHIHLDHAGVTGTLVRENPALRVYVHEKGAPHLVDPTKLVASATRLWGDEMAHLWGEIRPVPQDNLVVLTG